MQLLHLLLWLPIVFLVRCLEYHYWDVAMYLAIMFLYKGIFFGVILGCRTLAIGTFSYSSFFIGRTCSVQVLWEEKFSSILNEKVSCV